MSDFLKEAKLYVELIHQGKRYALAREISPFLADCLKALPRRREIDYVESTKAMEMEQRRDWLADQMAEEMARLFAEKLKPQILEVIRARDPINGYSPSEWRKLNGLPPPAVKEGSV